MVENVKAELRYDPDCARIFLTADLPYGEAPCRDREVPLRQSPASTGDRLVEALGEHVNVILFLAVAHHQVQLRNLF